MKRVWKKVLCAIMAGVFALGLLQGGFVKKANASGIVWKECMYDYAVEEKVYTSGVKYFAVSSAGDGTYYGYAVPKGTYIGKVIMSTSASRTSESSQTNSNRINYGQTWGEAYDIIVEMHPIKKVYCPYYTFSSYDLKNPVKRADKSAYVACVASEEVMTHCVTPASTTKGFLQDWAPRKKQGTEGFDNIDVSLGFCNKKVSVSGSLKVTLYKDDYVDIIDGTTQENGHYKMTYDYKKYGLLRICTTGRKKVVFGDTYMHNSVLWRNKSISYTGVIQTYAKFTVCSGSTEVHEITSAQVKFYSSQLIFK